MMRVVVDPMFVAVEQRRGEMSARFSWNQTQLAEVSVACGGHGEFDGAGRRRACDDFPLHNRSRRGCERGEEGKKWEKNGG